MLIIAAFGNRRGRIRKEEEDDVDPLHVHLFIDLMDHFLLSKNITFVTVFEAIIQCPPLSIASLFFSISQNLPFGRHMAFIYWCAHFCKQFSNCSRGSKCASSMHISAVDRHAEVVTRYVRMTTSLHINSQQFFVVCVCVC